MPTYTFTLKDSDSGATDDTGVSLPNAEMAYCYGCDVVRVCDAASTRLALARKMFRDIEVTPDPANITTAADVDVVVIATPVDSHVTLTKQALETVEGLAVGRV